MDVQVNLWGVLAGVVVSMVVGSIWYGKVGFMKIWMKLEGLTEEKIKKEGNPMVSMVGMAALAAIMAYVVAHVAYLSSYFYADYTFQTAAIMTGFWMWLGFVLPVVASNSLFALKSWKLTAINAGNWLVTLLGMGIVIGAIGV